MDNTIIEAAARAFATSIFNCMTELRRSNEDISDIYSVVLVVLDDFSDAQAYANTEAHFASTEGTDTDRWYFGEFWSEGMPLDFDAITSHLGEVEDWDEDDKPENSNAVDWLAAMILAMRYANGNGAFEFGGKTATAYCSMVDSLNAIWLEDLSAKFINDRATYTAASSSIASASADWYRSGGDQGSLAFRAAFESRLSVIRHEA